MEGRDHFLALDIALRTPTKKIDSEQGHLIQKNWEEVEHLL